MTKQASIAYISELMENPARINEADQSSIAGFRQSFPYFVPARYLEAYHKHKASPWAPAMLSAVMPYTGNWLLFCEFLNSDAANYIRKDRTEKNKRDERPILKAQTVIVEQKEPAPQREEVPPPTVEAVVPTVVATEPTPPAATIEEPPTAPVEAVEPLEVPELDTPIITIKEEVPIAPAEEVAAFTVAESTVEEDIKEVIAPSTLAVEQQIVIEEVPTIEAQETPEVEGHSEPAVESVEEIVIINEEEQPIPNATNNVGEDVLEEIENRHNNFWTQGEEENASVSTEDTVTEKKEDKASVIEEMTSYVPTGNEKPLIYPMYTEDYFLTQGEKISAELPEDEEIESLRPADEATSLMVMMSFSEWLLHFKSTTERQKEENKDQKALKTMWQKEKLAAAIEEENEEIPENVFEMAVNSITKEDGLASEALAEIYVKQGKFDKAVDMYRKLSLRNPQKNAYFARKIEDILKEKKS